MTIRFGWVDKNRRERDQGPRIAICCLEVDDFTGPVSARSEYHGPVRQVGLYELSRMFEAPATSNQSCQRLLQLTHIEVV